MHSALPDGALSTWFRDSTHQHAEATAIDVTGERVRYRELRDLVDRLCHSARVDLIIADDASAAQLPDLATRPRTGTATLTLTAAGRVPWYWQLDTAPYPEPYRGRPDEVAYVVFTSGSTGEPKGAPIRHHHARDLLRYGIERYGLGPGSRFAQAFDLTFDGSLLAMFLAPSAAALTAASLAGGPRRPSSRRGSRAVPSASRICQHVCAGIGIPFSTSAAISVTLCPAARTPLRPPTRNRG